MDKSKCYKELNDRVVPNTYIVLDVKQGISLDNDAFIKGDDVSYDRVCATLLKQVSHELLRRKKYSRTKAFHNVTTLENAHGGRWHVNICLRRPESVSIEEFRRVFLAVWNKSEWAYGHPYIEEMTGDAIGYSLKEGLGTILPRSTSF